jgi:hypothetical protein
MSTWTSRAQVLWFGVVLSACVAGGTGPSSVQMGQGEGAIVLAAPGGYCLAQDSVERTAASEFAAFTACRGPGAVLTATAGGPGSALPVDPAEMGSFLDSSAGRRALARSGNPAAVTVHTVSATDGVVLVRLTDRSRPPEAVAPGESWRAIFVLRDRLVTLTAAPGAGTTIDSEAGRALIGRFVGAMRGANGGRSGAI